VTGDATEEAKHITITLAMNSGGQLGIVTKDWDG